MEYLSLGTIVDTFALDGTLKIASTTSHGDFRYRQGNKILLSKDNDSLEVTVSHYRSSGMFDFVKVEEINSNEQGESYKGYSVLVEKNYNDLEKGYYFYSDLRGCKIIDASNKEYGVVKEVEEFPAQITLRVKQNNGKDFFVPFIKDFINKVDIENKTIVINFMEGML